MKRTKIALALSMCVLCLGMLAFAVYSAVTSATFNLNGTINFNPEGVYVDIEGKVLRGSSRTDLVELTGDNFTYKDRNYDDSTGETSGNFTMTSWSPEVAFLPSERFIQYQVTISNKSGEPITAIPSDITAITDVTATEEVSAVLRIEPGETKTYKLTLESTGDSAITDAQVALNFDIRTTSAYVEAQTSLPGGVTFTQNNATITAVSGDNSTSSILSLQKALFIPKTVDSTTITAYGSGSSISLSSNINFVIFEANLESIGKSAFQNLRSLEGIGLPNSVTSIGSYAFYNCDSLTSITIPEGITSILVNTFEACSGLTEIVIPEGVTSIGVDAFRDCSGLTEIVIPEGVTNIGERAFFSCSGLTSVSLPSSVKSIAPDAFYGCSDLTEIVIPEGVTSIGDHAFQYCRGLTSVSLPSTLRSIKNGAFYRCSGLTEIVIPEGVTSIGTAAFDRCSGLTSVSLPSSVTSIGSYAFRNCTSLTSLTINTKDGYVWQKASSSSASDSSWTNVNVSSNPEQNATWFKGTSGYYDYYWRQVAQ